VIERPVLHHQDHDVLDAVAAAGVDRGCGIGDGTGQEIGAGDRGNGGGSGTAHELHELTTRQHDRDSVLMG
jgi:hypothetical protein